MTPAQAASTNPYTFTAPASGLLQVRYVRAQRKVAYAEGAPSLAGYTLEVDYRIDPDSTSAFETIIDDIQAPPVPAKMASTTYTAGPRFEAESVFTHCRVGGGGNYICAWQTRWEQQFVDEYDIGGDQWYEYNQEDYISHDEAEPVLLLGSVEAGEQIDLELRYREADGTAHPMSIFWDVPSDELREGEVWGKEADYKGAPFTFLGGRTELLLVYVVIKEPTIQFLRQDDSKIPLEEDEADESVLMVSKFRTDDRLDASVPFLSTYQSVIEDGTQDSSPTVGDKFTFRPQVIGLEAGENVEFNVEVVRGDSAVYQEIFQAIGDSLDAGTSEAPYAYRGTQHLRLVSNARPPEIIALDNQFGYLDHVKYDDEHAGPQTIRAELEDTVRVTLVLDGDTTSTVSELPVGRPATEDGPYAVRTAYINFVELPGLNPALPPQPQTTIERMNEDWAQVAVRFDLAGSSTITPVSNVLIVDIRGPVETVVDTGHVSLEVEPEGGSPTAVNIEIFAGDTEEQIAQRLASEISSHVPNITAQHHPHTLDENENYWLVLVDRGSVVKFPVAKSTTANVSINAPQLHFAKRNDIGQLGGNVLGLNFKDEDEQTIDLFTVPLFALDGAVGRSGGDLREPYLPGMQNTILVYETAVDGRDLPMNNPFVNRSRALPFTAGHEAGHVLFDESFPGDVKGHSPDSLNLLFKIPSTYETLDATKRLTSDQNTDARADSGPDTTPALLHRN
jgi:hypothetical protein